MVNGIWSKPSAHVSNIYSIINYSISFAGVVIYYSWEAMLITSLQTRVVSLPFTDISSMMTKTDYKISLVPGGTAEASFRDSTNPLFRKAYKERIEPYIDLMIPEGNVDYFDHLKKLIMTRPDFAVYADFYNVA